MHVVHNTCVMAETVETVLVNRFNSFIPWFGIVSAWARSIWTHVLPMSFSLSLFLAVIFIFLEVYETHYHPLKSILYTHHLTAIPLHSFSISIYLSYTYNAFLVSFSTWAYCINNIYARRPFQWMSFNTAIDIREKCEFKEENKKMICFLRLPGHWIVKFIVIRIWLVSLIRIEPCVCSECGCDYCWLALVVRRTILPSLVLTPNSWMLDIFGFSNVTWERFSIYRDKEKLTIIQ